MSPKEKKEEIIQIFIGCQEVKTQGKEVIRLMPPDLKLAKRSAIKCVEQIIEGIESIIGDQKHMWREGEAEQHQYYTKVLEHLKNS